MENAAFRVGATLSALLAAMSWIPAAHAHEGTGTAHVGVLDVPSGGTASVPVEGCEPGDTMQWMWSIKTAEASTVSNGLLWTDASGQEHTLPTETLGQTFGTFVAPKDFVSARLVWVNPNDIPAQVEWSYGTEAPFWRRPGMILPASIPILLIPVAYLLGRYVDGRKSKAEIP